MCDERFKNCSYFMNGQKCYFTCKLISKVPTPSEEMGQLFNILNIRIREFEEFSPFFLEKEVITEDNKLSIYKFTSLQKHFLNPKLSIDSI